MIDTERFLCACETVSEQARERNSIGTLSEKSMHAALKLYFEPHADCHEVTIGGFVADIVGENGIIEIQTGSFSKMKKKLSCFLEATHVTVVHPIIVDKKIICIDEKTGEVTSKRKSPCHGSIYSIFDELWGIKEFLKNERLTLCLFMVDADEYRLYGGEPEKRSKRQRSMKGYFKSDRIPTRIHDEIYINYPCGYKMFLPDSLPKQYTVNDLCKYARIDRLRAGQMLRLLYDIGICDRVGKDGNAYIYETRL